MNNIVGNIITLAQMKEQKRQGKELPIFIQGVNCFKTMGVGLALQVRLHFPEVYKADLEWNVESYDRLGNIKPVKFKNIIWVNCYTQYEPGPRAEYKALESCMEKLFNLYQYEENAHIYLPMIGAGIGGLDWKVASKIIDRELIMIKKTLVIYDQA